MVLGLKLIGKPTTYQNQVLNRTKVLHGPRTQTYGETNYLSKIKFWTEPRYCMVLGLKPMEKPTTYQKSSFGQNQGIAWSSDSNLWGNQLLEKSEFWTEPRYCMVLRLKHMGKPAT